MGKWKASYDKRQYKIEWEESRPWLALVEGKCYCKYCASFLSLNSLTHLRRHSMTLKHKKQEEAFSDSSLNVDLTETISPQKYLYESTDEHQQEIILNADQIEHSLTEEVDLFPVTKEEIVTKRRRHYNKEWEKEFDWLMLQNGHCYCKICHKYIKSFDKASLKRHKKSRSHIKHESLDILVQWEVLDQSGNPRPNYMHIEQANHGSETSDVLPKNDNCIILRENSDDQNSILQIHSSFSTSTLRLWQSSGTELHPHNIMYPLFITDETPSHTSPYGIVPVKIDEMCNTLSRLVSFGLTSVMIFGCPRTIPKDENGSHASDNNSLIVVAIKKIRSLFPNLVIACDLCLCPYMSHGHCGILNANRSINNTATIRRLCEIAHTYSSAGAQMLVPTGMLDGVVKCIKKHLQQLGVGSRVSIISNSVKFSSCFFKEFNSTLGSASYKAKANYELPPGASGLALRTVDGDVAEGADMVMISPAISSLDIIRETKNKHPKLTLFAFQSSAECAMLKLAADNDMFSLSEGVLEHLTNIRRAGADVIVSYLAPNILSWIKSGSPKNLSG